MNLIITDMQGVRQEKNGRQELGLAETAHKKGGRAARLGAPFILSEECQRKH
jgi:hypothetical protein